MSFMDDARDIYNFAKCSKHIRNCVTPEIVVRSAVFAGGKTREAISNVIALVQENTIRLPSTFRLLRLVNAKQCENMDGCCGYNLVTRKAETIGRSAKRTFGLALCDACVGAMCHSGCSNRLPWDSIDFLAVNNWTNLLVQPFTDAATNERAGPFLLYADVRQVLSTYKEEKKQIEKLKEIHESRLEELQDGDARAKLIDLYLEAEHKHDEFLAAKERLALQAREAKAAARAQKKKSSVSNVLNQLWAELVDYRHKHLVLSGSYSDDGNFKLQLGPSRAVLGGVLSAPSGASQKRIQDDCVSAREVFDALEKYDFLASGSNFLRGPSRHRSPRHVRAIIRFCKTKENIQGLLAGDDYRLHGWNGFTGPYFNVFITKLREGKISEALLSVMCSDAKAAAFAEYVTRNEPAPVRSKHKKLAFECFLRGEGMNWPVERFGERFAARLVVYRTMIQNYTDYMRDSSVVAFLGEEGAPRNPAFTRERAVDTLLDQSSHQSYLLRNRNFDALLTLHRRYFTAGHRRDWLG